ncbi:MAG: LruC domain-containing protein, partial [Pseudomonadota bacterium]
VGAAYQNGFAIRLPGIPRTAVDEAGVILTINGYAVERTVLDTATNDATFLISYNLFNFVSAGEGCDFYRTEPGCEGGSDMGFELFVPLSTPLSGDLMGVFDPFLFATPGAWHGGFFTDPPGRSYEIHLKNYAPTAAIDDTIFGQQQDASDPDMDRYYQTENGLPWALEIPIEWKYPREYMDLLWAYPQFEGFVESNGTENRQWFLEENADAFFLFDAEEQE